MLLLTGSKNDISSLELSRQPDVKWDTAWLIKQKLMQVMLQRNSIYKLAGTIQIDDAYQGQKGWKTWTRSGQQAPFRRRCGNP